MSSAVDRLCVRARGGGAHSLAQIAFVAAHIAHSSIIDMQRFSPRLPRPRPGLYLMYLMSDVGGARNARRCCSVRAGPCRCQVHWSCPSFNASKPSTAFQFCKNTLRSSDCVGEWGGGRRPCLERLAARPCGLHSLHASHHIPPGAFDPQRLPSAATQKGMGMGPRPLWLPG